MDNFTNEQLEAMVEFYKKMNVQTEDYFIDGKIKSIFSFLKLKPELDENGNRKLTPYEILGVLPHIENGVEKPIVFFVKNRLRNIKFAKPKLGEFKFIEQKEPDDKSLIDFILNSYKSAIAQNNLAEAERHFDMLDKLTGGRAKHYIGSYYDYTKFYKQMKKQLLIDLFSHFFLIYLMEKKSIIKKGLIIKNKKFKAYNQNKQFINSIEENMPQIKSIRVDEVAESTSNSEKTEQNVQAEIDFDKTMSKELKKDSFSHTKVQEIVESKTPQQKSFIKKLRKRLFRKTKSKQVIDYSKNTIKFESQNLTVEME